MREGGEMGKQTEIMNTLSPLGCFKSTSKYCDALWELDMQCPGFDLLGCIVISHDGFNFHFPDE